MCVCECNKQLYVRHTRGHWSLSRRHVIHYTKLLAMHVAASSTLLLFKVIGQLDPDTTINVTKLSDNIALCLLNVVQTCSTLVDTTFINIYNNKRPLKSYLLEFHINFVEKCVSFTYNCYHLINRYDDWPPNYSIIYIIDKEKSANLEPLS